MSSQMPSSTSSCSPKLGTGTGAGAGPTQLAWGRGQSCERLIPGAREGGAYSLGGHGGCVPLDLLQGRVEWAAGWTMPCCSWLRCAWARWQHCRRGHGGGLCPHKSHSQHCSHPPQAQHGPSPVGTAQRCLPAHSCSPHHPTLCLPALGPHVLGGGGRDGGEGKAASGCSRWSWPMLHLRWVAAAPGVGVGEAVAPLCGLAALLLLPA